MNIEAIADEIIAARPRKPMQYPGLRSNQAMVRRKYAGHAYVRLGEGNGTRVRQLSAREIDAFRAHVEACHADR